MKYLIRFDHSSAQVLTMKLSIITIAFTLPCVSAFAASALTCMMPTSTRRISFLKGGLIDPEETPILGIISEGIDDITNDVLSEITSIDIDEEEKSVEEEVVVIENVVNDEVAAELPKMQDIISNYNDDIENGRVG